ncbi:MAG TPA: hypothetical protein VLH09_03470, partial [Bryobacteraceae bacterium]|nr:hypothetical protein [Bryobacteraceae bacterium]
MLKITHKGVNLVPALLFMAGQVRKLIRRRNMEPVNIEKLAAEIVEDLKDLKAEGKKVKDVKSALQIIPAVIKKVEEISKNVKLASEQKKELAVAVINKLVDIPWVPESAEGVLIGLAIDAIIAAVNK